MPEIWKLLFDSLTCIEVDGSNRLLVDLEIICWEGEHISTIIFMTVPGILIYVIVIPVYWYKRMSSNLKLIEQVEKKHL